MTDDTLMQLLMLFAGNETAVGTEDGGCRRLDGADWATEVERHFTGEGEPIGVYPIFESVQGGQRVWWGCIDFDDVATSLTHAWNTQRLLQRFGVASWIEVSRSKGHHLWVFFQSATPVALARRALLASQQLLDIPPKEVNPKQWSLDEGQLGNYVRLPYPGALGPLADFHAEGGRRVVGEYVESVGGLWPLDVGYFANLAHRSLVPVSALEALAERYVEPPPPITVALGDVSEERINEALNRVLPTLNGLGYIIWKQGPSQRVPDRSGTLVRLAYKLAENTVPISPEDALCVLVEADRRWGKFHSRADGLEQLERMVGRAYAGHSSTTNKGDT